MTCFSAVGPECAVLRRQVVVVVVEEEECMFGALRERARERARERERARASASEGCMPERLRESIQGHFRDLKQIVFLEL